MASSTQAAPAAPQAGTASAATNGTPAPCHYFVELHHADWAVLLKFATPLLSFAPLRITDDAGAVASCGARDVTLTTTSNVLSFVLEAPAGTLLTKDFSRMADKGFRMRVYYCVGGRFGVLTTRSLPARDRAARAESAESEFKSAGIRSESAESGVKSAESGVKSAESGFKSHTVAADAGYTSPSGEFQHYVYSFGLAATTGTLADEFVFLELLRGQIVGEPPCGSRAHCLVYIDYLLYELVKKMTC